MLSIKTVDPRMAARVGAEFKITWPPRDFGRSPIEFMIRTKLHFMLIIFAMLACGCAWAAGYRAFTVTAAGTATFGSAFLCTQFRTERGIWMGGVLLIVILLPQLVIGLEMTARIVSRSDGPTPIMQIIDLGIGSAILTLFVPFATYATAVNLRLFRPTSSKEDEEPREVSQPRNEAF